MSPILNACGKGVAVGTGEDAADGVTIGIGVGVAESERSVIVAWRGEVDAALTVVADVAVGVSDEGDAGTLVGTAVATNSGSSSSQPKTTSRGRESAKSEVGKILNLRMSDFTRRIILRVHRLCEK